jgi:hypothetical protein
MIMLNNANPFNADLFLEVGGSIGMRISLVKKKLSILSLFKEGICEGTKSNGFHIYSVV